MNERENNSCRLLFIFLSLLISNGGCNGQIPGSIRMPQEDNSQPVVAIQTTEKPGNFRY